MTNRTAPAASAIAAGAQLRRRRAEQDRQRDQDRGDGNHRPERHRIVGSATTPANRGLRSRSAAAHVAT